MTTTHLSSQHRTAEQTISDIRQSVLSRSGIKKPSRALERATELSYGASYAFETGSEYRDILSFHSDCISMDIALFNGLAS